MDYSQKTKMYFLLLIWDLSDDVSNPFSHYMNQQWDLNVYYSQVCQKST